MDLILDGRAHGSVASRLLKNNFDLGALRPYIDVDGREYITQNVNGVPTPIPMVGNALLRRDEWIEIDTAVTTAARERLRLIGDLQSAGLTRRLTNGFGKTMIESQRMGTITGATISMDPARKSEGDRPEFDIINLPLPVIHKDFHFTARQIATSRNGGTPIDTVTAQEAARKVAEEAEKLALGVSGSYSYGGGTVYGLTNFPGRNTTVIAHPDESDWTPAQFLTQLIGMRQQSMDEFNMGPWVLYVAPGWDEFLDEDYKANSDITLRARALQLNGITSIRTLDYLTGYQMVLVQMTSDNIRLVIGMDITTLQWETDGGMVQHYKVMAIMVPQLRSDIEGQSGIVHAVPA